MSFNKKSDPTALFSALKPYITQNQISCKDAHTAAHKAGVTPLEIGKEANAGNIRLTLCQLGLFGYGNPKKKLDTTMIVSDALKQQLEAKQVNGRISCLACWEIADSLKIARLTIGSACEILNIRIKPCQLGAF